jgi:hypothetical protein
LKLTFETEQQRSVAEAIAELKPNSAGPADHVSELARRMPE